MGGAGAGSVEQAHASGLEHVGRPGNGDPSASRPGRHARRATGGRKAYLGATAGLGIEANSGMEELRVRQLGIGRIATTGGVALLLLALAGPAAAAVDLGNLSADDMRALQRILETERTNASKRLPSGMSVTVIKTQTSPRVCRIFRIGRQGQEGQAVGCRIGAQRWALNASIDAARAVPVEPSPQEPVAVRPKVVAQSRPVQNSEDDGVEEAGATPAPAVSARSAAPAPAPVPDAGRAPAETQVAALPRAPFQAPRPLARPESPDPEPAAAGPTQAPVPRARPTVGGPAPAATAAPPPAAPVVEIDPSLRVLTSPPAVPPPLPRPGSTQPAAVAAVPAGPAPAAAPPTTPAAPEAAAAPAAPAVSPAPNPVAAAPAPKAPESLIDVPPAAFAQTPAVEALLPRTDAMATVPAPFTVPPPRSRPVVAAARPAQSVVTPATRPPPPAAADVPVPRRRPG
jgi:hypothetical protein